ncbi:sigma 54-interacting transcriptional regulator [Kaarinaea lacus]
MDDLFTEFLSLNLVGQSPEFCRVLRLIKKIVRYDELVLISDEKGTGKEKAARAIHYLSGRKHAHLYRWIASNRLR